MGKTINHRVSSVHYRGTNASLSTKFWSVICSTALVAGLNPVVAIAEDPASSANAANAQSIAQLADEEATSNLAASNANDNPANAQSIAQLADEETTSNLAASNANDNGVWDGKSAVKWTHGTGTAEDPYLIESAANFNYLANVVNSTTEHYSGVYFSLTTDLDLSAGNFAGIGFNSTNYYFGGNFNGNYHSITVAMESTTSPEGFGIFSYVKGTEDAPANIQNFTIKGSLSCIADSNCYVGSAVGALLDGNISRVRNEADVLYTSDSYKNIYTGGIVGYAWSGTINIDQCSNVGTVTGSTNGYAGGILGKANSASRTTVSNCYNTANVSAGSFAGGINGNEAPAKTADYLKNYYSCYNVGTVEAKNTGGIFGDFRYSSSVKQNLNRLTDVFWAQESSTSMCYNGNDTGSKQIATKSNVKKMTLETMQTRGFVSQLNNTDPGTWVYDSKTNPQNGGYPMLAWESTDASSAITLNNSDVSSISAQTWTGKAITPSVTVTYDGENLLEGTDYTVEYANNTEVGTATVTITGINGVEGSVTLSFDILADTVAIPEAMTGLTYNGDQQTGIVAGTGYTVSGTTSATNAGTYYATATLTDASHYTWSDGTTAAKTIEWSIGKQLMDTPAPASNISYVGFEKTGVAHGDGYTVTGGTAKDAGTYEAVCTVDDATNYAWAETGTDKVTVTWTINQAKVAIPTPESGLVYNGNTQSAFSDAPGYVLTGHTAVNAGEYTAKATLVDTTNYCWADGTTSAKYISWSIARAQVTEPNAALELEYNGSEQIAINEGYGYSLTGTFAATLPGNYTACAILDDNHMWDNGSIDSIEYNWTITAKAATAPTVVTGLIYNGTDQVGITGGEGFDLEGTTVAQNAGTYYVVITPSEGYTWADGSTTSQTLAWSIARASLDIPAGTSLEYTGKTLSGIACDETLAEAGAYTFSGTYEQITPGTYEYTVAPTANYQWSDGTTDAKVIEWNIYRNVEKKFSIGREYDNLYKGRYQYFYCTYVGYDIASFQWQYSENGGAEWVNWPGPTANEDYVWEKVLDSYKRLTMRMVATTTDGVEMVSNVVDWGIGGPTAVLTSKTILVNMYQTFTVNTYNLDTSIRAYKYHWYYSVDGGQTWMTWYNDRYIVKNSWRMRATSAFANHLMKCVVELNDGTMVESNVVSWNIIQ